MTSALHAERLRVVRKAVLDLGARAVLDLGCGEGDLLLELAQLPQIERLEGVDQSRRALETVRSRRAALHSEWSSPPKAATPGATVTLHHGSITAIGAAFSGFDVATLVEVIEHIDPERLSLVERAVFGAARPRFVLMTTPNADMNDALGVPRSRFRHPDHRFEWGRVRFQSWAEGVAVRFGYAVRFADVGIWRTSFGAESQMAIFERTRSCKDVVPAA